MKRFEVEQWSRSGNKIDIWQWSSANRGYDKGHKHHYGENYKDGYHKGFCKDDHRTDGRWYCEVCNRWHNGPWGRDFAGVGPINPYSRIVDRYLTIRSRR